MKRASNRWESGQAAVEAAIVLPLQIFFILGIIQMTCMQHAKLMTEYAAYQAARAGIVWNGNNERMHDAATIALLPTMGRSDTVVEMGKTWVLYEGWDLLMRSFSWGGKSAINGSNLLGFVRVDTINPSWYSGVGNFWKLKEGAGWRELDFDGDDAFPATKPGIVNFIRGFWDPGFSDDDEKNKQYREANVLSIRVRYWYELKIPFANWLIHTSWFAANATANWTTGQLKGAIWAPQMGVTNQGATATTVKAGTMSMPIGPALGIDHQKGFNTVYAPEMVVNWLIANGTIPLPSGRYMKGKHYFIPISATHSMRMQSNFHRKWLMHINPNWDL